MLRLYTRIIGNGIRNNQSNHTSQQLRLITQFTRNYGDGNYKFYCARRLGFSKLVQCDFFDFQSKKPNSQSVMRFSMAGHYIWMHRQLHHL